MLIAILLMFLACVDGYVSQLEGVILVIVYIAYILFLISQEKMITKFRTTERVRKKMLQDVTKTVIGIIALAFFADMLVQNGLLLARGIKVSESLIGIFVGLGTSLPELVVSIRAIMRRAIKISLGTLMGSNITDPLLSFGLGATILILLYLLFMYCRIVFFF